MCVCIPTCSPGGGGYGSVRVWGSDTDSDVQAGSPGGKMFVTPAPDPAPGGGVVKLIATKIVIAGQLTANGANGGSTQSCVVGGGGGSGGGILLAGDDITITCTDDGQHVTATATGTFEGWLPIVPDWSWTIEATATKEQTP